MFSLKFGAGVAQSVQCLATGSTTGRSGIDPRQRKRIFSLASVSRPALGSPSLLSNANRGSFFEGKARPGRDADHSSPSSTEVKNE
jgi:hypothetical protein